MRHNVGVTFCSFVYMTLLVSKGLMNRYKQLLYYTITHLLAITCVPMMIYNVLLPFLCHKITFCITMVYFDKIFTVSCLWLII